MLAAYRQHWLTAENRRVNVAMVFDSHASIKRHNDALISSIPP